MPGLPRSSVAYVLDAEDRVTAVDEAWNAFAVAEGAPQLTRGRIIGRPFAASIADAHTREICGLLFHAARQTGRQMVVPFRCDSPTVRRFMQLTIQPRSGGVLCMSTSLLREEPRPAVALLDDTAPRGEDLVRICGWCKRVPLPGGEWVEVEHAMRELGLLERSTLPRLSHGICPACSVRLEAQLETLGPVSKS
jgi:hypothetical protein